jgi:hypothetical protein
MSGIHPRVQLWARTENIKLGDLQREDIVREPLLEVRGEPWTRAYAKWVQQNLSQFYQCCHGSTSVKQCCAGALTDGTFDKWLFDKVDGENNEGCRSK